MITKLTKLIKLRQPDQNMKIDPRLIKYLMAYTKDKDSSPIDSYKLKAALKMKSEDIKVIYNKMVPDDIDNKLAYFILKLSELRKYKRQKISTDSPYVNDIVNDLKKGALGFKVGYFDDFKIHKMRNIFSKHIFEMYYDIYNAANIYHKLKNNNKPVNIGHSYFCNVIQQSICEYENAILGIKDIKSLPYFYAKIWNNMNKIKSINLLNECFKDNTTNPSKVMEYYKDSTVIKDILRKSINNCNLQINQFISEGRLSESNTEFFIVSNASVYDIWDFYTIDYGKVPYFIDKNIVEKILVIGKTVFMLKKISSINFEFAINIESNDYESELQAITEKVNDALKEHFYDKYNVFFCLRQAKQIFLCERADFTSSLYHYLQQHNKGGNSCYHKSIVHLLEKAILDTFNETNNFLSQIDVCILQNEQQLDYVSLFCKLDFPLNTILTKEIVMKYVSIFRFMWRLKKIESQLRLLRRKKIDDKSKIVLFGYLNVVTKLFTYFFESVIEKEYKLGEAIGIDELRKLLNTILDRILTGMFQVKGKGIEEIDLFVTSLDSMCLIISRTDTREVAHNEVKHNLRDFIEKNQYTLKGTSLHDLCKFT